MIDSLRELEKTIETFQNNVAASNELNDLLRGVIEASKTTNESFNTQANELLTQISAMPEQIKEQNDAHGEAVHEDVQKGLQYAVDMMGDKNLEYADAVKQEADDSFRRMSDVFNAGQERYTEILKKVELQIRGAQAEAEENLAAATAKAEEELAAATELVKTESDRFAEKADELPAVIEMKNLQHAEELKTTVTEELTKTLTAFQEDQGRYLDELQKSQEMLDKTGKDLKEEYEILVRKLDELSESGLLYLKSEFEQKTKTNTILMVILAVIITLIGGRFFF